MNKLAVIAIGGNSLIKRRDKQSVEDQYEALCETMEHVADIVQAGWQVLITHGNGPQVGFIMLRSEIARAATGLHLVPLVSCVADTQGAIGYQIQQALGNALHKRGMAMQADKVATVVTQTRVDAADPALMNPSKFIGEFYAAEQLAEIQTAHPDWVMKEDSGRGYRRVVPSPEPLEVIELAAIKTLLGAGFQVAAAGGGGIPVVSAPEGLFGLDAVIDKDLTSALLANALGAELLLISTAVENVCLNYGKPEQKTLGIVSLEEVKTYYAQGQFPAGSMGPKIAAAIRYLENGGKAAVITSPEHMLQALTHGKGTIITAIKR